jgi:hypothetical protein
MSLKANMWRSFTVLSLSLYSLSVIAETCAIVQFKPFEMNGKRQILEPLSANGQNIGNMASVSEIISGTKAYYLTPGWHSFLLLQWTSRVFKIVSRKEISLQRIKQLEQPTLRQIQIYVKAGEQYDISMNERALDEQSLSFNMAVKNITCVDSDFAFLANQKREQVIINELTLPDELEYRLRRTMTKVAQYHMHDEWPDQNHALPAVMIQSFGALIDSNYSNNGASLKVLAVSAYSPAAKLGLKMDDNIMQLGGNLIAKNNKIPSVQLTDYIMSKKDGEQISVQVERKGSLIQLIGKNRLSVVPEVRYQMVTSDSKIATNQRGE